MHGGAHVNIVVAVSGQKITMIGGDQGGGSYPIMSSVNIRPTALTMTLNR